MGVVKKVAFTNNKKYEKESAEPFSGPTLERDTHPMHFWTSAGDGIDLELPGNAVTTASESRAKLALRYEDSKGPAEASNSFKCSGTTAGSTPWKWRNKVGDAWL